MKQNELYHFGIKGQKWGVRRFQNKDGSLTPAGKKRYDDASNDTSKKTGLSDKQKIALKIAAGAAIAAAIVGGAHGAKKYTDVKSDKLITAKGKAIYDHLSATTPWHDVASFNRAMANASSESLSFVSQKRNITQKGAIIKEYRNLLKSASKGVEVGDLNNRWIYYMTS